MDEDGENQNQVGDDKSSESRIKSKKKGDSSKQRMAQLITKIVYQLERMRFILEKNGVKALKEFTVISFIEWFRYIAEKI